MNMTQAVQIITEHLVDELVIAANGRISREAFSLKDRADSP